MRILLIEDERQLAGHISRTLTRRGHQVRAQTDGVQGLREALEDPAELVVLDLNLPGMDGPALRVAGEKSYLALILQNHLDNPAVRGD